MKPDSERWASVLVDDALATAMVPWPCPSEFGPGGRYLLEELISIGPRSLVYRGVDQQLSSEGFEARVVLKMASRPGGGSIDARSARRIEHPHVVRVLDLGVDPESGTEYTVTEYVSGGDLSKIEVPVAPRAAAALVGKLASGVQASHGAGVVHCDLKPANVLLTNTGEPKLSDFDLCCSPLASDTTVRGNQAFMAPEQRAGGELALAPLADVYALGGILRWLITGRLPAEASEQRFDADLERIIARALEPEREHRYPSAGAMGDDLERWASSRPLDWTRPSLARRAWLWGRRYPARAGLLASLAGLTIGALGLWQHHVETERVLKQQAEAAIVSGLNQQIADLKSRGSNMLRGFIQSMGAGGGMTIDRAFQQIGMYQLLSGSEFVDERGRADTVLKRIMLLQQAITYAEVEERRGDTSEVMFARFALAHYLIDEEQSVLATPHVQRLRSWWEPRLPQDDPIMQGIAIMDLCIRAEADGSNESLGSLKQAVMQAADDHACEASRRLGERVAKRIEQAKTPEAAPDR